MYGNQNQMSCQIRPHCQTENVCSYGKQRDKWNVRRGINGKTDVGLSVQSCAVILDRNGRPETM